MFEKQVSHAMAVHKGLQVHSNMRGKFVYIIGSLRNPMVLETALALRKAMPDVRFFDDWACAGEHADDAWRDHETAHGHTFLEALKRPAAKHVFAFDKKHLDMADAAILVGPAGKSAHLELGYCIGKGKPGFILLDNPERWDVMYQFATGIHEGIDTLIPALKEVL